MAETLDQILELQIKIARAGETERLFWWRVDATDSAGGGDFFKRLVGSLSELSAVEAALEGAKSKEKKLLEEAGVEKSVITLFNPQVELKIKLEERWRHFKANPEEIPDNIKSLLNHDLEFNRSNFENELSSYQKPSYERSSFGRKARGEMPGDALKQMQQLASLLIPLEKNQYPLPYYPVS